MKPIPQATQIKRPNTRKHTDFSKRTERAHDAQKRPAVPWLELYQSEGCPFCHAVRTRLSDLGLDFIAHNIPSENSGSAALKHLQLVQAGGVDQIPFLVDHRSGIHLYESEDIIDYLNQEYGPAEPDRVLGFIEYTNSRIIERIEHYGWLLRAPLELAADVKESVAEGIHQLRHRLPRLLRARSYSSSVR